MTQPKIQVRKDSYDIANKATRSMQTLDTIPATSGFEGRPQVRSADQGVGNQQLVQVDGQSGDTVGDNDTFNMQHAGAGVANRFDPKRRVTDTYDETNDEYASGIGEDPSHMLNPVEGNVGGNATGMGAGIRALGTNNGVLRNTAGPNHVAGPGGTWNFVNGANVPLDTKSPSKF